MRWPLALPAVLTLACSKPAPPPEPAPAPEPTGADITFSSTPPGAKVELDGLPLDGLTPTTQHLEAGRGNRKARFLLAGYEPQTLSFLVPLAPYTVSASLEPAPRVKITTDPPGAKVELDGQPALAATPGELPLPHGPHDLGITLAGSVPVRRHLDPDQRGPIDVRLWPAAFISVTSNPPGAEVLIDGAPTGQLTPCTNLPVAAQRVHRVTAKLGKLRSPATPVKKLSAGGHASLALKLGDQDRADLLKRRAQLKKQLAALTVQQQAYEKKTASFVVADARRAHADEVRLGELTDEVDFLSSELADVEEQLRGDR
jgi:hypothetical protein